jgi:hypothetical protein
MSRNQGSGRGEKREFWRLALETWRSSGLSVRVSLKAVVLQSHTKSVG